MNFVFRRDEHFHFGNVLSILSRIAFPWYRETWRNISFFPFIFSSPPLFVEKNCFTPKFSIDRRRRKRKKKKKGNEKSRFISEGAPVSAIVAKSRPSLTMMERLIGPLLPPRLRVLIVIVRWRREDKEPEGALKNWRASGAQRALNKRCLPRGTEERFVIRDTGSFRFDQ